MPTVRPSSATPSAIRFKDTAGPSLNILIKLMAMVSVVFAGLIVFFSNGQGLLYILVSR